jgi:hypothetical protein
LDVERKDSLRASLFDYGYAIAFDVVGGNPRVPTLSLARSDGALWLSAYCANTTTDTRLRFPLGAPLLCGMETRLEDGHAIYRFSRSEHRECRIFVEQKEGVISCRECPPVNAHYRRNIRANGFRDATVRIYAEHGCACAVSTIGPDETPRFLVLQEKYSEAHGRYFELEHVNDKIYILFGRSN